MFNAKVTTQKTAVWTGGYTVSSPNGPIWHAGAGQEYKIELVVDELHSKYSKQEYPSHTIMSAMKYHIFAPVTRDIARLELVEVNMIGKTSFRATINLTVINLEKFKKHVHDFRWNSYSQQFDGLMSETLIQD